MYWRWNAASLASCSSRFLFESASCCFRKSVVPSADCSRALRFSLTNSEVISPQTCWAVWASSALNEIKKPGIPPRDCSERIGATVMAFRVDLRGRPWFSWPRRTG